MLRPAGHFPVIPQSDRDGDGLADAYDAAPQDAGEFVSDTNGDGFFELCNIHQFQAIGSLGSSEGSTKTLDRGVRMRRNYQLVRDLDASVIANYEPIGDCGPQGQLHDHAGSVRFSGCNRRSGPHDTRLAYLAARR